MYTFSSTFTKKMSFFVCHYITIPRLLLNWKKTNTKEFNCLIALIIKRNTTLKLQFIFDFSECLWAFFSWKFLVLSMGCGCMTFDFTIQLTLSQFLSMPMNKKPESKGNEIFPNCWERFVKWKSNLNFIRVIKNLSFDQHFYVLMVQIFLKIVDNFLFPTQRISWLVVQLYCVKH